MTRTVRISFEQSEIIQRYFQDPQWSRFDQITEAVMSRRQEFFAGRVCAALAYKEITGKDLSELPMNADRSPRWPSDVVGSISHNEKYVVAELSTNVKSLGIDLATLGSVQKHLQQNICTKNDVTQVSGIDPDHLLTFIFSFKESLFKTVYPVTKGFFDFQAAYVSQIDLEQKTFEIVLDDKIAAIISKKNFSGDFVFIDQHTILSRIILP